MRIALATCDELPEGDADDALMAAALAERGHEVRWRLWDDGRVDWSDFDVVVVRSTWDYQRRLDEFLAWAAAVPVLLNPPAVLGWNTDKRYLADLASAGVGVIETTFVTPGEEAILPEWERVRDQALCLGGLEGHGAVHLR